MMIDPSHNEIGTTDDTLKEMDKQQQLFTESKKEVVPKWELFQVLSHAHSQISHRGWQIIEVASRKLSRNQPES